MSCVWKLEDFWLLRFYVKSANLTHLEALKFDFYWFLRADIYQINKHQSCLNGSYRTFRFSNIDFSWNMNDKKVLKFPHCGVRVNFSNFQTVCTCLEFQYPFGLLFWMYQKFCRNYECGPRNKIVNKQLKRMWTRWNLLWEQQLL